MTDFHTRYAQQLRTKGLSDQEIAKTMLRNIEDIWAIIGKGKVIYSPKKANDTKQPTQQSEQARQRYLEVYRAIIVYKQEHDGCSPSLRDLIERTSYTSTSAISYALDNLRQMKLIRLPTWGSTRGIEVIGAKWSPPPSASTKAGLQWYSLSNTVSEDVKDEYRDALV